MRPILLYVNHRLLQSKKEGIAEDQAAHCEHGKEQDRVEVIKMSLWLNKKEHEYLSLLVQEDLDTDETYYNDLESEKE